MASRFGFDPDRQAANSLVWHLTDSWYIIRGRRTEELERRKILQGKSSNTYGNDPYWPYWERIWAYREFVDKRPSLYIGISTG